jgi:hypothetical protein
VARRNRSDAPHADAVALLACSHSKRRMPR